jgi:DNA-directed RNA polymerase subunit K/omega
MINKNTEAALTTITRNLNELEKPTGNIYEAISIIAKRSNQISLAIKEELTGKLNEFASTSDNLEEIFENREQIEISKYYERMPKSNAIAIQEFMNDEVYFRRPEIVVEPKASLED